MHYTCNLILGCSSVILSHISIIVYRSRMFIGNFTVKRFFGFQNLLSWRPPFLVSFCYFLVVIQRNLSKFRKFINVWNFDLISWRWPHVRWIIIHYTESLKYAHCKLLQHILYIEKANSWKRRIGSYDCNA